MNSEAKSVDRIGSDVVYSKKNAIKTDIAAKIGIVVECDTEKEKEENF